MSAVVQPPGADMEAPSTRPDLLTDSMNAPLEVEREARPPIGLSLFWRTFFMLALTGASAAPSPPTKSAPSAAELPPDIRRIVERGAPERLFRAAEHPYTRTLLAAVPGLRR